jgi:uncharacterized integral membrane protein (TIGR00698 family)
MKPQSGIGTIFSLIPGIALSVFIGVISILAAQFIGESVLGYEQSPVSSVMLAILIGMAVGNIFPLPQLFESGIGFAIKKILRFGIILLGFRLSILQIALLGGMGVPVVIGCIAAALLITLSIAKALNLSGRLGTLIAVGTSICGVSAIVATAPVIGADEEEVAYAVSVITVFGILATIIYPFLAYTIFSGDATAAGIFLGTSIHDTSQVSGAGLVYAEVYGSPEALDAATVTKLARNLFMGIVIPLVAVARHRKEWKGRGFYNFRNSMPLFILLFILLSLIRTIGDASLETSGNAFGFISPASWNGLIPLAKELTVYALVTALAAVGIRIRISRLLKLGIKPFIAGLGAALSVGMVSYLLLTLPAFLVRL